MILHSVYVQTVADTSQELAAVMEGLAALMDQIEGFSAFQHGPNIDVEGKSPEAPYGFICTFDDRAALDRYATNPDHKTLGARLVALCGGADRIMVYDLEVSQ